MSLQKSSTDHTKFSPKVFDTEKAFIVGIAGGTASGKTTLSNKIAEDLKGNVVHFSFDCFYKGLEGEIDPDNYDFDHPNSLDFDYAYECLLQLSQKKPTKLPIYCFKTHCRLPDQFTEIQPKNIVIIEGILSFYDQRIRDLMDFKIFVHCDSDVALCRRLKRDIAERGRDYLEVLKRYNKFIKTDYDEFVKPYMKCADIIIPGGASNDIGLQFVLQNLQTQLKIRQEQELVQLKSQSNFVEKLIPLKETTQDRILLQGLSSPYIPLYFKHSFSFWKEELLEKIKETLSKEFGQSWDEIKADVQHLPLENSSSAPSTNSKTVLIYEPVLENMPEINSSSTIPTYILSIFANKDSLTSWVETSPSSAKLLSIFLVDSKQLEKIKSFAQNDGHSFEELLSTLDTTLQSILG